MKPTAEEEDALIRARSYVPRIVLSGLHRGMSDALRCRKCMAVRPSSEPRSVSTCLCLFRLDACEPWSQRTPTSDSGEELSSGDAAAAAPSQPREPLQRIHRIICEAASAGSPCCSKRDAACFAPRSLEAGKYMEVMSRDARVMNCRTSHSRHSNFLSPMAT